MKTYYLFLTLSLIALGIAYSQAGPIPSQTKSEQYAWLEIASPRTSAFRGRAQEEVETQLHGSKNFSAIEKFLLQNYLPDVANLSELVIDPARKIVSQRMNFHTLIVDRLSTGDRQIFSTESLLPRIAEVIHLVLSPSKKYLVIQLQIDGNIDVSRYVVYDLEKNLTSGHFDGLSYMYAPAWTGENELLTMHPDSSPRLTSAMSVNLQSLKANVTLNRDVYKFKDWVAVTEKASNSGTLTNMKSGEKIAIKTHLTFLNDVEETSFAFYYVLHTDTDGTIFRLKKEDQASPEAFIPAREGFWLSFMQLLQDKYLLVNYSRDSLVTLVLYDIVSGKKVSELSLPDNYDFSSASFEGSEEKLQITVYNFLSHSFNVSWDIKNPEQTDLSVLPTTFPLGETEFISKLEYFKAHDGESIPARIVYLKETVLSGDNPAYIETYGAFNYISYYLFPALDEMKIEFLKKGGILVGTGVRGGAERGYSWYLAGTGKLKATPALDLISIADGLVASGYTQSKKIVSSGVSAGGDTVSVAAQLSPSSFGLVIPISGIHDALGYLHLDRWGPQWLADYLNPYSSTDFYSIYARAPLEIRTASSSYPEYFIVCGEEDSRVSKVHSYKLKASLDEFNKGKVALYSVRNSGHWPQSSYTHGRTGIKTNAVIWSRIYDYLGLSF